MNEYDAAKIADLFAAINFIKTDSQLDADLIVLNTCSVRLKAEEKLFSDLGRMRKIKQQRPNLIIAVGGCVASQEKENILKRAPHVDIVFGPQTLHRLPAMYRDVTENHLQKIDVSFPQIEKFDHLPKPRAETAAAFVTIIEGCNRFCSYCVVPYTRGREISRPAADILAEIHSLVKQGVKEINLLGQNVNAYCDSSSPNNPINLAKLIEKIAAINDIARLRFTTSHPAHFSDELIALYATVPKLVTHLHLPVQSGSNKILQLMRRGYTVEDFIAIIKKLRKIRPNMPISSDFIVGFPGETTEDFAYTLDLIKTINFDISYSFIYSPRPNTPAAKLKDDICADEKKQRLSLLQNLIAQHAARISAAMVGTTQTILVTGTAKKHAMQLTGRTENNRIVNFAGSSELIGQMVPVKITEILTNSLLGEKV